MARHPIPHFVNGTCNSAYTRQCPPRRRNGLALVADVSRGGGGLPTAATVPLARVLTARKSTQSARRSRQHQRRCDLVSYPRRSRRGFDDACGRALQVGDFGSGAVITFAYPWRRTPMLADAACSVARSMRVNAAPLVLSSRAVQDIGRACWKAIILHYRLQKRMCALHARDASSLQAALRRSALAGSTPYAWTRCALSLQPFSQAA